MDCSMAAQPGMGGELPRVVIVEISQRRSGPGRSALRTHSSTLVSTRWSPRRQGARRPGSWESYCPRTSPPESEQERAVVIGPRASGLNHGRGR
jgi:hypothetical protein